MICATMLSVPGCMKWEHGEGLHAFDAGDGVLIGCEGNFQYGNATLSFYDPMTRDVDNEVFLKANGMKLGDVVQSITIDPDGSRAWIIVNNSHVAFAIDTRTFLEKGRITGLPSPRYMHIISPTKAYITQLWSNSIIIVNPSNYSTVGYMTVPDMLPAIGSTERMLSLGGYVYVACWSYQDRLLRIDPDDDSITATLTVAPQPRSMVADYKGRIWLLCDGAYPGQRGDARLQCVDPETMEIVADYTFRPTATPSSLCTDPSGRLLYWIDGDVWEMSVDETSLPVTPLIASRGTLYFSLYVNPASGEIYLADAIDYQQPGIIYRYTPDGQLTDQFYVGVNPSSFGWTGR
ncbi:MAG: YncE family protein [Muribaculaceae bacterium]|nr:YncE family protein [Muribaculaceae bacterium]